MTDFIFRRAALARLTATAVGSLAGPALGAAPLAGPLRLDWHLRFDMEKEAAVATRRRILEMIATERVPFTRYHMRFPAVGFVEREGSAYRYVPASHQLDL